MRASDRPTGRPTAAAQAMPAPSAAPSPHLVQAHAPPRPARSSRPLPAPPAPNSRPPGRPAAPLAPRGLRRRVRPVLRHRPGGRRLGLQSASALPRRPASPRPASSRPAWAAGRPPPMPAGRWRGPQEPWSRRRRRPHHRPRSQPARRWREPSPARRWREPSPAAPILRPPRREWTRRHRPPPVRRQPPPRIRRQAPPQPPR